MKTESWWDVIAGILRNGYIMITLVLVVVLICLFVVLYPRFNERNKALDQLLPPVPTSQVPQK
jgi:hypothetical protein